MHLITIPPWWLLPALLLLSGTSGASENPSTPPIVDSTLPDRATLEREGTVIGEILIIPENIFDTEDPKENKALFRLANKLHIRTQPHIIRQQLLFASGNRYSQRLIDETERILRSTRYLYDASIEPTGIHDGEVDLLVKTRDVWTLNPGISFSRHGGENTSGVELEELNLFGTGTKLSIEHLSGVDRDSNMMEYRDHNLGNSWMKLEAVYADNSDGSLKALDFGQPFYALDTPWAAELSLMDNDSIESLYDLGKVVNDFRSHRQYASASWGHSRGVRDGWVQRWRLGATFDENTFSDTPLSASTGLRPEDRTLVYPWIGFELIQDEYDTFRNHDQIDRTEDFHLGARLSARLGWADPAYGADRSALILSAKAQHGSGSEEGSTLLVSGAIDGRVESGELRDAILDGAARYYVKQSAKRLFFTTLHASVGHALDLDTQLLLGGDNGLRGYPLRYQTGEARALLTIEQRYFTEWYPFQLFRIGGAAFLDVGRTWGETPLGTPSQGLLKDIGVGLRIANTRSGLGSIIHVDLAFPLDGDSSIDNVQLLIETKEQF